MFAERITADRKNQLKCDFPMFLAKLGSGDQFYVENQVQGYLEHNSELIPAEWMLGHGVFPEFVISKLKVDHFISDFAYVTKNTGEWYIVLIELEDPRKPIFLTDKKRVFFSAKFDKALGQIESWRTWLLRNDEGLRKLFESLFSRFGRLKLFVKFVLVHGRDIEFGGSSLREERFADKSREDIRVITYDSLIRRLDNPGSSFAKNIATVSKNSLKVKLLNDPEIGDLGWLTPHQVEFTQEQESILKERGFDIQSWKAGAPLIVNGKLPFHRIREGINNVLKEVVKGYGPSERGEG